MTTPTRDEAVRQQFEAVTPELVAIHQRAWNIEMTRQQQAGEPVSHIKATRAALAAVIPALRSPAVAALVEAAKEARRVIGQDRKALYDCHHDPKADAVIDAPGIEGLREYDTALAGLDAALAQFATLAGESQ